MKKSVIIFLSFFLVSISNSDDFKFWKDGIYNPDIPTPKQILGYEIGDFVTEHHQMERYIDALSKSSNRIKVIRYGESYERRGMYLLIISSPENLARLNEIRENIKKLTDPRITSESEARKISETNPIIVWLNYSVDGDETAAFEAGIQVAYQLCAGEDEITKKILKDAIVIINLPHNPDSHQKAVAWFKATFVGKYGNPDPYASEHRGDWRMKTNYNHYLIDLNRDAFACSQIETQKVVEQFHYWNPQVFADHHGETKNMFFVPYAPPVNLNIPSTTKKWARVIGLNIARGFDEYGWSYYTEEVFDLHYPGYWDSYPSLNGAIGMTFETDAGGRKGFQFEREDETIITFKEGIHHHFIASMKTLEASVNHRKEILFDFYKFRQTALEEAKREQYKLFIIVPDKDKEKTSRFIELCLRHGIEIYEAKEPFTSNSARSYFEKSSSKKTFKKGVFIIPMYQPQKRLLKTLFEPDTKIEEGFLKEARFAYEYNKKLGKNVRRLPLGFYDVTAWSLPITWGIECYLTEDSAKVKIEKITQKPVFEFYIPNDTPKYAYVFKYDTDASAKLLAKLLSLDFKVAVASKYFYTETGDYFPRGTVIVRVERNKHIQDFHQKIKRIAREIGVDLYPINTAYTERGIDLGSNWVIELKKPKVAVITEEPTSQTSYGALWFLFEQIYEYDFTPIRWDYFSSVDLYRYNVIVIPDANANQLKNLLGEGGVKKLKEWISNGGVLVTLKNASVFPTLKGVELTSAKLLSEGEKDEDRYEEEKPQAVKDTIKPREKKTAERVEFTPGAIMRVKLDTLHFLSFGYGDEIAVHIYSNLIFEKSKDGANPGVFADKDVRISGFVWEDMEKKFPGNAYLIDEPVGRGRVIMFADDPNFRLYWLSLNRLFLNSIFFAPSF
ncbi:MAG: M14 family zinc carboxypeptidase [Candidatus Kryptonium sp.]|nr:M14 family zinc carboxypeptidase [Candidatus Kryptonium sp.]MCX7761989.1 M14 family zinc carboxypeptidase [Candidatus Kryptonium sp.]MDW8108679.1 M14 family zinc carboxypeptidase [Candidatus Kryptonium sp.]